jgi:hypothetical protein
MYKMPWNKKDTMVISKCIHNTRNLHLKQYCRIMKKEIGYLILISSIGVCLMS